MANAADKKRLVVLVATQILADAKKARQRMTEEEAVIEAKEYIQDNGGYDAVIASLESDEDLDEDLDDDDEDDDEDLDEDEDLDDDDEDLDEDDEDGEDLDDDDEDLDEDEGDDEDLDDDDEDLDEDDEDGEGDAVEAHLEIQKAAGRVFGHAQAEAYLETVVRFAEQETGANTPASFPPIEKVASMREDSREVEFERQATIIASMIYDSVLALRKQEALAQVEKRASRANPELAKYAQAWRDSVNARAVEILAEKNWDVDAMIDYINGK